MLILFSKYLLTILLLFSSFHIKENSNTFNIVIDSLEKKEDNKQIFGTATWYGETFHGRKMANGKIYNMHGISCATRDRTIPFGSKLKITNIKTGKSIIVVVTDRMAKTGKHTIDLSVGAFIKLAPRKQGVIKVKIERL